MKLDLSLIDYIQNILKVCKLTGIEEVILERGMVRGLHTDRTVALIQAENVPTLPFGSIGLTRLNSLQTRIDIARSLNDFYIEYVIKPDTDFVFSLTLKAKNTKIDYRCANPDKIDARRTIKDPIYHYVKLTQDAVSMLSKGIAATSAEKVTLISNSEGVSFEMMDVNNDVFKYVFADKSEIVDPTSSGKFAHRYPTKLLLTAFKENPEGELLIGAQGTLRITLHGLNIIIVPLA